VNSRIERSYKIVDVIGLMFDLIRNFL